MTTRRRLLTPVLFLLLLATGCRSEILVEIATTIYLDGSLDRQLTIHGRETMTEPPWEDGTLAEHTGVTLAAPDAWDRVETGPAVTRAEGFFSAAADVPPLLAHGSAESGSPLPDRGSLVLDRDDLVILDRYRYEETFGDPYGQAGADAALDQILDLLEDWIRDELEKSFPRGVDLDGVHRFMAQEIRPVARKMLAERSSLPGKEEIEQRVPALQDIFRKHGLPVVSLNLPGQEAPAFDRFWELQAGPLLDWTRARLAAAISTEEETVEPYRLSFVPTPDSLEETATRILIERWGSEQAGTDALIRWIQAMEGYYGSDSASHYRFRSQVHPSRASSFAGTAPWRTADGPGSSAGKRWPPARSPIAPNRRS